MADYRSILAVVDLTDDSRQVIARAQALAAALGAELQILHVVEYVPVEPLGDALLPAVQIEADLIQRARRRLSELAAEAGLPESSTRVEAGNIRAEIVRIAQEQNADLIVVGSRERHGLALLLNYTEDSVLHTASCDVLAVRLRP